MDSTSQDREWVEAALRPSLSDLSLVDFYHREQCTHYIGNPRVTNGPNLREVNESVDMVRKEPFFRMLT